MLQGAFGKFYLQPRRLRLFRARHGGVARIGARGTTTSGNEPLGEANSNRSSSNQRWETTAIGGRALRHHQSCGHVDEDAAIQEKIKHPHQELQKMSSCDDDMVLEGRFKSIGWDKTFVKWIYSSKQFNFLDHSTSICFFALSKLKMPKVEQQQACHKTRPIADKEINEHQKCSTEDKAGSDE